MNRRGAKESNASREAAPSTIRVPPGASMPSAWAITSGWPITSNETSTPRPPVSFSTRSTVSASPWSVRVALRLRAGSSFSGSRSTAITSRARASAAPCTTFRPTPPSPNTATSIPGSTLASNSAAPTPVAMPHPSSAACSNDSAGSMGIAPVAGTTTYGQNEPTRRKGTTGAPSRSRWTRGSAVPRGCSHHGSRPRRQFRQRPQGTLKEITTDVPGASPSTPVPTSSTTPASSWPSTTGKIGASRLAVRSEWQRPVARIATRTSPGPGGSTRTSSIITGPSRSAISPARTIRVIFAPFLPLVTSTTIGGTSAHSEHGTAPLPYARSKLVQPPPVE